MLPMIQIMSCSIALVCRLRCGGLRCEGWRIVS